MTTGLAPERHDSLPDIPEPSESTALFGHGDVLAALAAEHRANRLHHGLILAGAPGIGKATLAFHFANHLVGGGWSREDGVVPPDPVSPTYRQIASDAHPSVLHLTRPVNEKTKGFRSAVTAEEVRRIGRFLGHTAADGGWRVVIVDPVDDLNRHAANALLKNLEEPPSRTLFLLVSHQPGRLLATIRSRCRIMRLRPLEDVDLRAAVASVHGNAGPLPDEIVARAKGSVRDALTELLSGGRDIAAQTTGILDASRLDLVALSGLADAVAGRGAESAFQVFNLQFLDLVADAARTTAAHGRPVEAERLAAFWQASLRRSREAEAYNLDKRQHVMGMVTEAHPLIRAARLTA